MNLIARERDAHWYDTSNRKIVPMYQVLKADGSGVRATTLADAKKSGGWLWPSVTHVIEGVLVKPGLNAYRIEQGLMAALTLPRIDNEPLDVFARRVVDDMDQQSEDAKAFGRRIHNAIEAILGGNRREDGIAADLLPYLESFIEWRDKDILECFTTERVVGHPKGYAGMLDLEAYLDCCGHGIVDFKTQRVRRNGNGPKPVFYEEWGLQLAAYGACVGNELGIDGHVPRLVSVIIDSAQPGPVHVKVWDNVQELYQMFLKCFDLWCWRNNYRPTASDNWEL